MFPSATMTPWVAQVAGLANTSTIMHALTYRVNALDDAFISPPSQLFRLETPRKELVSIGSLNGLSLELLHEILALLDLQSVSSFRIVNTKTMWVVDSLPRYNILAAHAPGALWALVATRAASHITVSDIYDTLCTHACSRPECGKFGAFLFLPDFKRCCLRCLTVAPEFMPMLVSEAKKIFRVSEENIIACVPIVHTVPGNYTMANIVPKLRLRLLSRFCVYALEDKATKRRKRLGRSREFVLNPDIISCVNEQTTYRVQLQDWKQKHVRFEITSGRECVGPDHIHRFMCATPFPYFDRITSNVHRGVFCKGCKIAMGTEHDETEWTRWWKKRNEIFSEEGFLEHFKECRHAQKIWEAQGASKSPSK